MRHIAWVVGASLFSALFIVGLVNGLYELVRVIGTFRTSKPTGPAAQQNGTWDREPTTASAPP